MILIKILFWLLMLVALLCSLIIVIVGAIWIINEEFKEMLGIDLLNKWIKKENK